MTWMWEKNVSFWVNYSAIHTEHVFIKKHATKWSEMKKQGPGMRFLKDELCFTLRVYLHIKTM